MKSTKFIFSAVAAAVIFSMGSATAEAKTTIRIGTFAGPEHPVTLAINYFKENIEKESNGEIVVKHFPNNQLGPESVVIDQIKRGTIQMAVTGSQIKKDEPNIGLSDTPYVIHSWAQARACYDEEGMKIMSGNYESVSEINISEQIKIVVTGKTTPTSLSSTTKPTITLPYTDSLLTLSLPK